MLVKCGDPMYCEKSLVILSRKATKPQTDPSLLSSDGLDEKILHYLDCNYLLSSHICWLPIFKKTKRRPTSGTISDGCPTQSLWKALL